MEHAWAQVAVSGDTSHIADILADALADFKTALDNGRVYNETNGIPSPMIITH